MVQIDEVLDSNIVIDALKNIPEGLLVLKSPSRKGISIVTWIEVMAGAEFEDEVIFNKFLSQFTLLAVTPEIAALAARMRRTLRLKFADAVIYATAQSCGRPLITRNTKDFRAGMSGVIVPYRL